MCGLVLAAGRYNLSATDVELFAKLLYVDTFRGEHSTGVFSMFKPYGQPQTLRVVKEAVPGPFFLANKDLWNQVSSLTYTTTPTTAYYKPAPATAYPRVMFGHNRYATRGAVNGKNAHPFVHGHITLAHNGTLRDQTLLPDYELFEVDSENVAYSMMKIGADETIQKLKGAFTLIWHDANLNTLNIIRNEERPFHLAELSTGDWFGASEEWMLTGILTRGKTGKNIRRHFEIEVGVQYIFDVSDGCKLVEEKKHTLPTFPSQRSSRDYDAYEDIWEEYYGHQRHTSTPKYLPPVKEEKKEAKQALTKSSTVHLLERYKVNAQIDDIIEFEMLSKAPYTQASVPNRGLIKGWLPDENDYVEVHMHNMDMGLYREYQKMLCVITSAYELNCLLTIIARPLSAAEYAEVQGREEEDEADESEEMEVLASGEVFTRGEWDKSSYSTCANCTCNITFDDIPDAHILSNADACLCSECYKELIENVDDIPEYFVCSGCGQDHLMDEESSKGGLCKACFQAKTSHKDEDPIKVDNGWTVTKVLWEKMNHCRRCYARIPFSDAGVVAFDNGSPLCMKCTNKVVKK